MDENSDDDRAFMNGVTNAEGKDDAPVSLRTRFFNALQHVIELAFDESPATCGRPRMQLTSEDRRTLREAPAVVFPDDLSTQARALVLVGLLHDRLGDARGAGVCYRRAIRASGDLQWRRQRYPSRATAALIAAFGGSPQPTDHGIGTTTRR